MTSERDKLIDIIKPAGAHDYWPQKAADYILGSGWLAEHDAALVEKLADGINGRSGGQQESWLRARAAELREGNV